MAQDQSTNSRATTQKYLDIHDITNDLLVLRDGSVSLVLQVNAINFGLLSEPEQDAIIFAYAALINSLSYPIEIVIKSLPKDVSRYLEYVDSQLEQATSDLRRQQIQNYRQFVSNLISEQNVLDKNFYVVIPMTALELGLIDSLNPLNSLTNSNKEPEFDKYALIERAQNMLIPRRDHLIGQFNRIGLQARQLTTKELIHLFYTAYNREAAEGTRVVDTREYTTAAIQAAGGFGLNQPVGSNEQAEQGRAANQSTAAEVAPTTTNSQEANLPSNSESSANLPPANTSPTTASPTTSAPAGGATSTDPLETSPQQYDSTTDSRRMDLDNVNAIPRENFNTNASSNQGTAGTNPR